MAILLRCRSRASLMRASSSSGEATQGGVSVRIALLLLAPHAGSSANSQRAFRSTDSHRPLLAKQMPSPRTAEVFQVPVACRGAPHCGRSFRLFTTPGACRGKGQRRLRSQGRACFDSRKRLPIFPAPCRHRRLRHPVRLRQPHQRHLRDTRQRPRPKRRTRLGQFQRTMVMAQVPLLRHATQNPPPPLGLRPTSKRKGRLRETGRRLPPELRTLSG